MVALYSGNYYLQPLRHCIHRIFAGTAAPGRREFSLEVVLEFLNELLGTANAASTRILAQGLQRRWILSFSEPSGPIPDEVRSGWQGRQRRLMGQTTVGWGTRPRIVFSAFHHTGPHRIPFNISHGGPEVRLIHGG